MISSDRANAALLATMNYRLGFHLHGVARTVTRTANSPCGSSSLITSLSKSLQAAERRRADLPRARRRWIATQGLLEGAHLIFIDETPTGSKRRAQPLAICPGVPFSKLTTLLRRAAAKTVLAQRGVAASSRVIALTNAPTIGHSLFPYDQNLRGPANSRPETRPCQSGDVTARRHHADR
jgi:hypothetical protein